MTAEEYKQWSKMAQKAQIDMELDNKTLAENLGYSRQLVTAVVNGRKKSKLAIARISKQLHISKPEAKATE